LQKKSITSFQIIFAITIAIKNHSKKIGDRFSIEIRSAIFRSKSVSVFYFEIDLRLKPGTGRTFTNGAIIRDPFFVRKSNHDFQIKFGQRFLFSKRIPILKL